MKYALLIFPKPGSHEALGPDEYQPVNAEYLALREDPRAVHLAGGVLAALAAEFLRLKAGENMPRRIVDDAVPTSAHNARDRCREKRLPKPCSAREQQISAFG